MNLKYRTILHWFSLDTKLYRYKGSYNIYTLNKTTAQSHENHKHDVRYDHL